MIRRVFAAFVALCLSVPAESLHAFADSTPADLISHLTPPSHLGAVTEKHIGPKDERRPLIILLQDLHAHEEGQRHIAKLLDFIAGQLAPSDQSHLPFVLAVEGATGAIDSSPLLAVQDSKIRHEAQEFLLREAVLTGAEYFAVQRGLPKALLGVEEERYYHAHRDLFRKTWDSRHAFVGRLEHFQQRLPMLEGQTFGAKLKGFRRAIDTFEKGTSSSAAFRTLLHNEGRAYGIDIPPTRTGQDEIETYRHLRRLASLIEREIAREDDRVAAANRKPTALELVDFRRDLELLLRVASLKAEESDVREFAPRLNAFVAFAKGLDANAPEKAKSLRSLLSSSIDYYAAALMRNAPMARHTLEALAKSHDATTAVLIAGGFHTSGLVAEFKKAGADVLVITPSITALSPRDEQRYLDRLLDRPISDTQFKKAMQPGVGRLFGHLASGFDRAPMVRELGEFLARRSRAAYRAWHQTVFPNARREREEPRKETVAPSRQEPLSASLADAWATVRWGVRSSKYRFYTVLGAPVWEWLLHAPVANWIGYRSLKALQVAQPVRGAGAWTLGALGASSALLYAGHFAAATLVWSIVAGGLFAAMHRAQVRQDRWRLAAVGVTLSALLLAPLALAFSDPAYATATFSAWAIPALKGIGLNIAFHSVFNAVALWRGWKPARLDSVVPVRETWAELPDYVGYVRDQVLTRPVSRRPDYLKGWLHDEADWAAMLASQAGQFERAKLDFTAKRQSRFRQQALVEITANGMDAVDAWISRFGVGFYQTLGQLSSPEDRVFFAGETPQGERIGLAFRLSDEGTIQIRPMGGTELRDFLGKDHKTTKVQVRRALSVTDQAAHRRYLSERLAGSRRMRVELDGEFVNPLQGYVSATGQDASRYLHDATIRVRVDDAGYTVENPGTITPDVLIEKVAIPRSGRQSGMARAKEESRKAPSSDLLVKLGTPSNSRCEVTVQVAGMGIETFVVEGLGLPLHATFNLPATVSFNESRDRVIPDALLETAILDLIERLDRDAPAETLVAQANVLMAYLDHVQHSAEKGRDRTMAQRVEGSSSGKLSGILNDILKQRKDLLALPADPALASVAVASGRKKIYVHESLINFRAKGVEGFTAVEGFAPGSAEELVYVSFEPGAPHPPIFQVGKTIVLDRALYERIQSDDRLRSLVNWWMSFQVGYGTPRKDLGRWHSPNIAAVSKKVDRPDGAERGKTTEHQVSTMPDTDGRRELYSDLVSLIPGSWKGEVRERWITWIGTLLASASPRSFAVIRTQVEKELAAWTSFTSQFSDVEEFFQPNAFASQPVSSAIQVVGEPLKGNISKYGELTDGRRWVETTSDYRRYYVETAPLSRQFKLVTINGSSRRGMVFTPMAASNGSLLFVSPTVIYDEHRVRGTLGAPLDDWEFKTITTLPDGRLTGLIGKKISSEIFDWSIIRETAPGSKEFVRIIPDGAKKILSAMAMPDGRVALVAEMEASANSPFYIDFELLIEAAPGSVEWHHVQMDSSISNVFAPPTLEMLSDGRVIMKSYLIEKSFWGGNNTAATKCRISVIDPLFSTYVMWIQATGGQDDDWRHLTSVNDPVVTLDATGRLVIRTNFHSEFWRETSRRSGVVRRWDQASDRPDAKEVFRLPDGRLLISSTQGGHYVESSPGSDNLVRSEMMEGIPLVSGGSKPFTIYNDGWSVGSTWHPVNPSVAPPVLTPESVRLIGDYIRSNHYLFKRTEESYRVDQLTENILHFGNEVAGYLSLATVADASLLGRLPLLTRQRLARIEGENGGTLNAVAAMLQQFVDDLNLSDELLARYAERIADIAEVDDRRTLMPVFLEAISGEGLAYLTADADLNDAPPEILGFIRILRDPEMATLPEGRPAGEKDWFGDQSRQEHRVTSFEQHHLPRFSLGRLLAWVRVTRSTLKEQGAQLRLLTVADLLKATLWEDIDSSSDEDSVQRVIRAQADGYAVWVRETVQNARDEMRKLGMTREKITINAWFEGGRRVTRITDPVGMSLQKLLMTYLPIGVSDKGEGLTGKMGQGNYSLWLDADRVRIRTGDGSGRSWLLVIRVTKRDKQRWPLDFEIERFEEYEDGFKGTAVEHIRNYGDANPLRYIEAAFLQHSVPRFVADIQDVEIEFQGKPLREETRSLSKVHDDKLGDFEVLVTKGASRVTADGLEVHALRESDWEGVPSIIRKALQNRGRVMFRWPKGVPLTGPRDAEALTEINELRWKRLRLAAIYQAAIEALQQDGQWIPDLPQDVLSRVVQLSYFSREVALLINIGRWDGVDFERIAANSEEVVAVLMRLKGYTSQLSLNDAVVLLKNFWPSAEETQKLKEKMPGLKSRIDESIARQALESADRKRVAALPMAEQGDFVLTPSAYPRVTRLLITLFNQLGEPRVGFKGSPKADATAWVSSSQPNTIVFSESWLKRAESILEEFAAQPTSEEKRRTLALSLFDVIIHEYVHVLEFRDSGRSSHITHQTDGELENSFPFRMRALIEKLIDSGLIFDEVVASVGETPKASAPNGENSRVLTTLVSAILGAPHRFQQAWLLAKAWFLNGWYRSGGRVDPDGGRPAGEVFDVGMGQAIVTFLREQGFAKVRLHAVAPGWRSPSGHVVFNRATGEADVHLNPYLPFEEQLRVIAHELAHIEDPLVPLTNGSRWVRWRNTWSRERYAMDRADALVAQALRREAEAVSQSVQASSAAAGRRASLGDLIGNLLEQGMTTFGPSHRQEDRRLLDAERRSILSAA